MITFRQYQANDHEQVIQLHVLAIQAAGAYLGEGPWEDDLQDIEKVYLHNRGDFLVGIFEERIVAMGALRKSTEERAEIKRMRVHPDFQRSGIGSQILKRLEARALELGYTTLHLDTVTALVVAQQFYRQHGFKETGETRANQQFTDIFFEKHIR